MDGEKPDKATLLVEYQAAQSSAQFHDGLIWSVTNVLWIAALVLFGFILTQMQNEALRVLLTALSVLGLSLVVFAWICALQFNSIKNQKYKRCKEIEADLGMTQHTRLEYPRYFQRVMYGGVMVVFVVSWSLLLIFIWIR